MTSRRIADALDNAEQEIAQLRETQAWHRQIIAEALHDLRELPRDTMPSFINVPLRMTEAKLDAALKYANASQYRRLTESPK